MDVGLIGGSRVLGAAGDVARIREAGRRRRLFKLAVVVAARRRLRVRALARRRPGALGPAAHLAAAGACQDQLPAFILITVLCLVIVGPMLMMGRSPHVTYRPSEISTSRSTTSSASAWCKDEVVKTLNLFLAYQTFREQMGGNPRRAILFEGPPGTGKTYMAKAMAREAGVPFLFVVVDLVPVAVLRPDQPQDPQLLQGSCARRPARRAARSASSRRSTRSPWPAAAWARTRKPRHDDRRSYRTGLGEGIAGVVNELLIQLQSFDEPTERRDGHAAGASSTGRTGCCRRTSRSQKQPPVSSNILVIGATNRAADLDPALLRPGRFDRSIHFDVPGRAGPARDHRLLPRQEGARPRARQGRAPRPARRA